MALLQTLKLLSASIDKLRAELKAGAPFVLKPPPPPKKAAPAPPPESPKVTSKQQASIDDVGESLLNFSSCCRA